jgi:LacI family transcriptional regulator
VSKFKRPQVALLIETSRAYGRGLLRGIATYARLNGPWALFSQDRGNIDPPPDWLEQWSGDGIISRVEDRVLEKAIIEKGLPAIDLRGKFDLDMPLIETNDRRVVEMAADHLMDRGFRHYAYCGFAGANYSERRLAYFPPYLLKAGHTCHVYPPTDSRPGRTQKEQEQHGILYAEDLARWIESLPKPVGIMACSDLRGLQVLNACRAIDVAVPEEVAVIGVDNDELQCELSDPPLSSVEPNTEKIGYEAAALLDRMMQGEEAESPKMFVEPIGVVTRQSTDVLAIEDRHVAAALSFIRRHACDGINVEDVLRHHKIARSSLERRFNKAIGRTPKAEIVRVQIDRVKQLLAATDYILPRIAELAGFKHSEYMSVVFKQKTGQTPGQYRRQAQVSPLA